jgi:hypothetical protein
VTVQTTGRWLIVVSNDFENLKIGKVTKEEKTSPVI